MSAPFLKWAGGKGYLLPEILKRVPDLGDDGLYLEPFLGGGAVFFGLRPRYAILGDSNNELIRCFTAVRDDVDQLIGHLKGLPYDKETYYRMRAKSPEGLSASEAAARTLYLNRCGYNGLYRVNSKGKFNVPFGKYKNPKVCDETRLRSASAALGVARLSCRSFEETCAEACRGDFVYLDPPYHPVSKTANFTGYTGNGFGFGDQVCLRDVCRSLHARGVRWLLSNSDVPEIRYLYAGFKIEEVKAPRRVNSKAHKRGLVTELLISNEGVP